MLSSIAGGLAVVLCCSQHHTSRPVEVNAKESHEWHRHLLRSDDNHRFVEVMASHLCQHDQQQVGIACAFCTKCVLNVVVS